MYNQGACKYGNRCKYAHDRSELAGALAFDDEDPRIEATLVPKGTVYPHTLGKAPLCQYFWDLEGTGTCCMKGDNCNWWHSFKQKTKWQEEVLSRYDPIKQECTPRDDAMTILEDFRVMSDQYREYTADVDFEDIDRDPTIGFLNAMARDAPHVWGSSIPFCTPVTAANSASN